MYTPKQIRKALVGAATFVTQAIALGLVPDPYDKWSFAALSALGTYGIFAVRNDDAPAS
jgi:hypothetical protein